MRTQPTDINQAGLIVAQIGGSDNHRACYRSVLGPKVYVIVVSLVFCGTPNRGSQGCL